MYCSMFRFASGKDFLTNIESSRPSLLKSLRKGLALAPMSSTYLNTDIHSHAHLRDKIEGFVKNKLIVNEARPSFYDFLAVLERSSKNGMENWEGPSLFAVYQ